MGAALATALAAAALFAGLAGVAESGSTKAYAGTELDDELMDNPQATFLLINQTEADARAVESCSDAEPTALALLRLGKETFDHILFAAVLIWISGYDGHLTGDYGFSIAGKEFKGQVSIKLERDAPTPAVAAVAGGA